MSEARKARIEELDGKMSALRHELSEIQKERGRLALERGLLEIGQRLGLEFDPKVGDIVVFKNGERGIIFGVTDMGTIQSRLVKKDGTPGLVTRLCYAGEHNSLAGVEVV